MFALGHSVLLRSVRTTGFMNELWEKARERPRQARSVNGTMRQGRRRRANVGDFHTSTISNGESI